MKVYSQDSRITEILTESKEKIDSLNSKEEIVNTLKSLGVESFTLRESKEDNSFQVVRLLKG